MASLSVRRFMKATCRWRILIHAPSLKWPLSLRGTSGERAGEGLGRGWGEGLVPSNCRALLKSPLPDPLPTSPSWGEGIDRGFGDGIKMRPTPQVLKTPRFLRSFAGQFAKAFEPFGGLADRNCRHRARRAQRAKPAPLDRCGRLLRVRSE